MSLIYEEIFLFSPSAKLLSEIQTTLGNLHAEFARIADYSKDQSTAMSRLLTEQSAISSGLAQVARDITANASNGGVVVDWTSDRKL